MKTILTILLSLSSLVAKSQCDVLRSLADTTEFEGVRLIYFQVDSNVQIQYDYMGFSNKLGDEFSFSCDLKYLPAIPEPVWKNENFICFLSGCGSSCFSNYLAPLNHKYRAEYAGQFLLDSTNTIFMSLLLDGDTYEPYMELKNFTTGESQKELFSRKEFPGAIPIESLDYSKPHEKGFTYHNKTIYLYLEGGRVLKIRVKV